MTSLPDPNARPPFWQHRYDYLALKIIVLIVAAALALRIGTWLVTS